MNLKYLRRLKKKNDLKNKEKVYIMLLQIINLDKNNLKVDVSLHLR